MGLIEPAFTEEQIEEIREELRKLKSSGTVYCFTKFEEDVEYCLELLKREQDGFRHSVHGD